MIVGVVPFLNPFSGGIYQYSLSMLQAVSRISADSRDEYRLFLSQMEECALLFDALPVHYGGIRLESLWRVDLSAPDDTKAPVEQPPAQKLNPDFVQFIKGFYDRYREAGCEWMLFTAPHPIPFERGLPFVAPIHDLQHRLQPEFPEVSADGEAEKREYQFRNMARFSVLILVDSEVGKEDVLNCYAPFGLTEDRVKVLPFLPANYLSNSVTEDEKARLRARYGLPKQFLFYPAQFWQHKNHLRIVEALRILEQESGIRAHMVFAGGHMHGREHLRGMNYRAVMQAVDRWGLTDRVHYLGYVPNEDLSGLYAQARGLVMPTFFGPTNIPILEAWAFGCPVLTSDIRGVREQAGDAALLADPRSAEAIADGMRRLWEDEPARAELAERGRNRLGLYTPDDYERRLAGILDEASERVRERRYLVHPMVAELEG